MAQFRSRGITPVPQNGAPAWLSGMGDNTWIKLAAGAGSGLPANQSGATLNDVKATGGTNPGNVMKPWGGAVVDTRRQRFNVGGGGHADSSDSARYSYALNVATPACSRFDTSVAISCHSANNFAYCPLTDDFWQLGQFGINPSGDNTRIVYKIPADFSSSTWTNVGSFQDLATGAEDNFDSGGCGWDSGTTQKLWQVNQYGCTFSVDPTNGTLTTEYSNFFNGGSSPSGQQCVWLWPEGRAMLAWLADGTMKALNLDSPSSGWTSLTTSGLPTRTYAPGYCWSSLSKKMLWWDGDLTSNAYFHTIIPPTAGATTFSQVTTGTWTAGTVAPSGSNTVIPSNPAVSLSGNVTYSRFNTMTIAGIDILLLLNDSGTPDYGLEPLYVYRMPAAGV